MVALKVVLRHRLRHSCNCAREFFDVKPFQFEPLPKKKRNIPNQNGQKSQRQMNTDWCKCNHCILMETEVECRCCCEIPKIQEKRKGYTCITESDNFKLVCLNIDVVELAYVSYCDDYPYHKDPQIHNDYQYIACRQFALWIWHRLGKRNCRELPSCVLKAIREKFPPEGPDCGFQYPRI